MKPRFLLAVILAVLVADPTSTQDSRIIIKAGTVIDGTGKVIRDTAVVIEGSRIAQIQTAPGSVTYDLSTLTLLPGLIDTHVHIANHFGADGRAATQGEAPAQAILHAAENAHMTLMAGFTTIQSIGSRSDLDLRQAIARGKFPGPRLLTSVTSLNENSGAPDTLRQAVRALVKDGADLIKLFASKSIREGGAKTMTDAQIEATCAEAKAAGKRTWVHAHAADAVAAAARAGCFAVTHGSQVTDAELKLMAERGTYFEPNVGLVSQNYIENKARFLGIGNYDEAGFAFMEKGIPVKLAMFKRALTHRGLKVIMGTDAVAGAHGQNAREIIYRVQQAGQPPMDALVAATSLNAEALGMADRVGRVAAGLEADLMKAGTVYKNITRSSR
jgi:imidazolonepropionase-like amidohydrolase